MGAEQQSTKEKLCALREQMRAHGLQAYLIVTDDYHASEYVGDYFRAREYMSGFTGSAGTLVVCEQEAALWTDGRYFLQAQEQLAGSGIALMKSGEAGVPSIGEYLVSRLPVQARIGFDGRTVSRRMACSIRKKTDEKQIVWDGDMDLVAQIWINRPPMSAEPVYELPSALTGSTREEKLAELRSRLRAEHADCCLVSALDEIAWLLNLRGADIAYTPVFLSYLIVEQTRATLCVHTQILSQQLQEGLAQAGVRLAEYESVEQQLAALPDGASLLVDRACISERLMACIPAYVNCVETDSPVAWMKAVKTPQETANAREVHVRDGVALTRFIYWLKQTAAGRGVSEIEAAERLEELRREQKNYLYQSFAPIIAYGAHGAIVHYSATEQTNAKLQPRGFCLADTGGHYMEGTTDVTRTIALGELSTEEIRAYTSVLRGHLRLAAAQFPEGVCGQNLDILARQPLWEQQLDYLHGTGHGVGCLLSVHEGPQRIHWRLRDQERVVPFAAGMIVSDEPGLYVEGKFGIRHENLLLCCKGEKSSYGQFLYFEPLTLVPFDRTAIDATLLQPQERELLNAYHARVCAALEPYLPQEEAQWLREQTAPV